MMARLMSLMLAEPGGFEFIGVMQTACPVYGDVSADRMLSIW